MNTLENSELIIPASAYDVPAERAVPTYIVPGPSVPTVGT